MATTQPSRTLIQLIRHPMILLATALVSVGVIGGLVIGNALDFAFELAEIGIVLLTVSLLLFVTALVQWFRRRKIGPVMQLSMVILSSSVASIVLFIALPWSIERWEVTAEESYVSRALPVLDQMKAQDGVYPRTLPESVLGPLPELLKERRIGGCQIGGYQSYEKTFRFFRPDGDIFSPFGEDWLILSDTERSWHGED